MFSVKSPVPRADHPEVVCICTEAPEGDCSESRRFVPQNGQREEKLNKESALKARDE